MMCFFVEIRWVLICSELCGVSFKSYDDCLKLSTEGWDVRHFSFAAMRVICVDCISWSWFRRLTTSKPLRAWSSKSAGVWHKDCSCSICCFSMHHSDGPTSLSCWAWPHGLEYHRIELNHPSLMLCPNKSITTVSCCQDYSLHLSQGCRGMKFEALGILWKRLEAPKNVRRAKSAKYMLSTVHLSLSTRKSKVRIAGQTSSPSRRGWLLKGSFEALFNEPRGDTKETFSDNTKRLLSFGSFLHQFLKCLAVYTLFDVPLAVVLPTVFAKTNVFVALNVAAGIIPHDANMLTSTAGQGRLDLLLSR